MIEPVTGSKMVTVRVTPDDNEKSKIDLGSVLVKNEGAGNPEE